MSVPFKSNEIVIISTVESETADRIFANKFEISSINVSECFSGLTNIEISLCEVVDGVFKGLPKNNPVNNDELVSEFAKFTEKPTKVMTFDEEPKSSYHTVKVKGNDIDIMDISHAFNLNCAEYNAVKKILCAGKRGNKSYKQDVNEAINSLKRAIELKVE